MVRKVSVKPSPAGDLVFRFWWTTAVSSTPNITSDFNAHRGDWEPSCDEPDTTGIKIYDWTAAAGWEILNSGATTRVSYTGTFYTPDV